MQGVGHNDEIIMPAGQLRLLFVENLDGGAVFARQDFVVQINACSGILPLQRPFRRLDEQQGEWMPAVLPVGSPPGADTFRKDFS
jgi:hypothetical protein